MMQQPLISDEAALRIALAVRSLPEVGLGSLLDLLVQHLGEPLSEDKLAGISPKSFRVMVSSLSETPTRRDVSSALAILTNNEVEELDAPQLSLLPPLVGPKLTVAITSNQGEMINGHYGSCMRVLVYEVNAYAHQLVDVRNIDGGLQGEARAEYMLNQLKGCQMLFTLSIGGPAAAKVTRANIHPVKKMVPVPAAEALTELSQVISHNPPPWICKLLGITSSQNALQFEED